MAKVKEKHEALKLRRQGESIKEIAAKLDVSKGSVSLWCQDIVLTDSQSNRLKKRQIDAGLVGRQMGSNQNKQKRLAAIASQSTRARKEIGTLTKRDLLLLGIGLYWGEGIKSRSGMAAIVNSDPAVILVGKQWFETCLGVDEQEFRPYVYISAHHKRRKDTIVSYWSKELSLPPDLFKVILLNNRPKKIYENHDAYFGVMHLRVRRSTDLKYHIIGLIDACK